MKWLAWKMLTGDRAKYLGIVFGVAFGSLLIAQQSSIFVGLMRRTSSQILDVTEADIWVMDKAQQNIDEIRPMPETRLHQVRGVEGVEWAVRLFKGLVRCRTSEGNFRQAILIGVDDTSLVGGPRRMLQGTVSDLRRPDGIVVDAAGYKLLFPGQPVRTGVTVDMNDRRAVVVGICDVTPPFQTFPVIYTRYSQATLFIPAERNTLSFVLAKARPGVDVGALTKRITAATDLKAMSWDEFFWFNINYFLTNTGIPINFGITVVLGFIVGAAIAGQTFYLFTLENLKQFGSLKAMGVDNLHLIGMILFQAVAVGLMGFGIGIGMAAGFFEFMEISGQADLRGMFVPWQVVAITACAVFLIVIAASLLSLRKVLVLEPAMVFK
ncbi:ABC transporter permease [Planctomicrobium piriforme]|uniref:Putative ABC transport system permease protein n=1 Tax=Planctomicrobium piriforme TaxID=1576369 RepID=A0A1I3EPP2_9PLAN|nr:ABC transporter permease [Planctomicrobium piriforme]SFI00833.1 putative ABC transport system permease protein [Planctomicrobium piriforme]